MGVWPDCLDFVSNARHYVMRSDRNYRARKCRCTHDTKSVDRLVNEGHNWSSNKSAVCLSACRLREKGCLRVYQRRDLILSTLLWPIISVMLVGRSTSLFVDSRWRKASCQSSSVTLSVDSTAAFMAIGIAVILNFRKQRQRFREWLKVP